MTTFAIDCGSPDEFDRKAFSLLAEAVNAVNRVAKHFKDRTIRNGAYDAKDMLLSRLIESDAPEVDASWQKQPDGDSLVLIRISDRLAVHCPFERLSPTARCKIVGRIGPGGSGTSALR